MLGKDELKKIALEECMDMLGKDLVMKYKELCCPAYGIFSDGLFHYTLGLSTEEPEWKFGGETPMDYYAFVTVDPETGEVTRNYIDSILPSDN